MYFAKFYCLLALLTLYYLGCAPGTSAEEDPFQTNATLYWNGTDFVYKPGVVDERGLGYATFTNGLGYNGWGILDVKSGYADAGLSDDLIMYAAGYLEGALTYKHIYNQYQNVAPVFLKGRSPEVLDRLRQFLMYQQMYMLELASKFSADPFWRNVGLIMKQFTGLVNGYEAVAPSSMSLDVFAFQVLNGVGDLIDLMNAIDPENQPDFRKMSREEIKLFVQRTGHCSALIKVLGAYENIFFAHSSWFAYASTNRIWKYYNLNVNEFASKRISFSSYPGFLESLDDFYLMENGLVMLQTTNNIFNASLYKLVKPQSVPAWVRVRVANQLSRDASEWGYWLAQNNSGTYNNQYMVLDLNKVRLNESIEDGALYVVEQIPGYVEYGDQTAQLRLGYWPSYNVPFYEKIYNLSGYPEIVASKGVDFSYQLAPRAKIFRRDAAKVTDMDSMKHIMRYNNYVNDPYSEHDSCDTVCCRGDLSDKYPRPDGCYDTKVSDYFMAAQRAAWIINGPSTGDYLKPFTWNQFNNVSHIGLPDVYNFDFVLVKPTL